MGNMLTSKLTISRSLTLCISSLLCSLCFSLATRSLSLSLLHPLFLQILIETQELPGSAGQDQREAILKNPDNLAVCTVVKLLRTIAVNGFRYAKL